MGAKLTKSKSLSISGKTKEQQTEIMTTVENTNNHLDISTNDDNKQTAKNKNKKKKEEKSNKKSSTTKVDKSTNTENCVLPSSSFAEQLVGEQVSPVTNPASLEIKTIPTNVAYLLESELPNKDIQELRETCFQNGIISTEFHSDNQQSSNEHNYQANNLNIAEEAVNNAPATIVTNGDLVHCKEQQQQPQFVES
jgi:hypothetical protein